MLGTVDMNRGIFQENSLSPLSFIMIMPLLLMILKDEQKGYKQGNTSNLLFMEGLKLSEKSQDERCFTWTCSRVLKWYWKMVFGMDKCAVLGIKKEIWMFRSWITFWRYELKIMIWSETVAGRGVERLFFDNSAFKALQN